MKLNFKKVASVMACTAMLGSTMGLAAAANTYPAPFVVSGASDVAIVYGSGADSDRVAALGIGTSLQTSVATATVASGTVTLTGEGDKVKLEGPSNKLNINDAITDVKVTDITYSDMPTLLAKKTYTSYESNSYDYEQKLTFYANINVTHFQSNDYKSRTPAIGISVPRATNLLNYTLTFTKTALSDISTAARLTGFENSKITLLGKEYTILQAYNGTTAANTKLVLMGGASSDVIALNEEQEISVNGKTYKITLTYVDSTKAKFTVDGVASPDIASGGTWKMADGTVLGIKALNYQAFAGGVMSVDYTLGAEKVTIEGGQNLLVNDLTVDDITGAITRADSGTKAGISKIILTWKPNSNSFVTADQSLEMPGLKSVKLVMTGFITPKTETIELTNNGNSIIQLKAPIKQGTASIDLAYANNSNIIGTGTSATAQLRTSNNTMMTYNTTTDSYFISSWSTTTAGETYLLRATTRQSAGLNYTTITDGLTATQYCVDKQAADTCSIGSVVLTLNNVYTDAINLSINTAGGFNTLYTPGGAKMYLPFSVAGGTANGDTGYFNSSHTSWKLAMLESDKNNNIAGGGGINLTMILTTNRVDLSTILFAPSFSSGGTSSGIQDPKSNNNYNGFVRSALATELQYTTGLTQNTAKILYHGGESYADVYITSPEVGTTAQATILTVKDSEITDAAKAANLIVVGGSCINTVAAKLLGSEAPLCGAAFTTATGVGTDQFLIETFANPYATTKVATLVAGYEAADTTNAANALKTKTTIDLSSGKKYTGNTAGDVTLAA